uniref:Uncharacterized protein n=1 Tax=Spermophilus dauricus TaxID=99837 RepID=A0A8C9Q5W2_SPEDA
DAGKKLSKHALNPTQVSAEVEIEGMSQLRRFGDKLNFHEKLLNLIFRPFS